MVMGAQLCTGYLNNRRGGRSHTALSGCGVVGKGMPKLCQRVLPRPS